MISAFRSSVWWMKLRMMVRQTKRIHAQGEGGMINTAHRTMIADRSNATSGSRSGGGLHGPGRSRIWQAQPQCAGRALSICVSHWQMEVRSRSEVGKWRTADIPGNVARSLHSRRLCNRRRIQDDKLLRRTDRARGEPPHV